MSVDSISVAQPQQISGGSDNSPISGGSNITPPNGFGALTGGLGSSLDKAVTLNPGIPNDGKSTVKPADSTPNSEAKKPDDKKTEEDKKKEQEETDEADKKINTLSKQLKDLRDFLLGSKKSGDTSPNPVTPSRKKDDSKDPFGEERNISGGANAPDDEGRRGGGGGGCGNGGCGGAGKGQKRGGSRSSAGGGSRGRGEGSEDGGNDRVSRDQNFKLDDGPKTPGFKAPQEATLSQKIANLTNALKDPELDPKLRAAGEQMLAELLKQQQAEEQQKAQADANKTNPTKDQQQPTTTPSAG